MILDHLRQGLDLICHRQGEILQIGIGSAQHRCHLRPLRRKPRDDIAPTAIDQIGPCRDRRDRGDHRMRDYQNGQTAQGDGHLAQRSDDSAKGNQGRPENNPKTGGNSHPFLCDRRQALKRRRDIHQPFAQIAQNRGQPRRDHHGKAARHLVQPVQVFIELSCSSGGIGTDHQPHGLGLCRQIPQRLCTTLQHRHHLRPGFPQELHGQSRARRTRRHLGQHLRDIGQHRFGGPHPAVGIRHRDAQIIEQVSRLAALHGLVHLLGQLPQRGAQKVKRDPVQLGRVAKTRQLFDRNSELLRHLLHAVGGVDLFADRQRQPGTRHGNRRPDLGQPRTKRFHLGIERLQANLRAGQTFLEGGRFQTQHHPQGADKGRVAHLFSTFPPRAALYPIRAAFIWRQSRRGPDRGPPDALPRNFSNPGMPFGSCTA